MEARPFASLTASLLARKGAARPAMRRPHHGSVPVPTLPLSVQDDLGWNDMGEDRDDLGPVTVPSLAIVGGDQTLHPAPAYSPAPAVVPVPIGQQAMLAEALGAPAPAPVKGGGKRARATLATALSSGKGERKSASASPISDATLAAMQAVQPRQTRAAFTLRLDPERHLRLRLASTLSARSAQRIVTEALDVFLASQPDLAALRDQMPAAGRAGKGKSR
ncbi:MAG: hypothetical protein B7Z20_03140 [Sphingobium sp. 32-64-5]|nr:MAG: hypothetical protein B7Z20_03140 [Sphingobium sp. 32-64-5]